VSDMNAPELPKAARAARRTPGTSWRPIAWPTRTEAAEAIPTVTQNVALASVSAS